MAISTLVLASELVRVGGRTRAEAVTHRPLGPRNPVAWHSSMKTRASYLWASWQISLRGAMSPSMEKAPSVATSRSRCFCWREKGIPRSEDVTLMRGAGKGTHSNSCMERMYLTEMEGISISTSCFATLPIHACQQEQCLWHGKGQSSPPGLAVAQAAQLSKCPGIGVGAELHT